MKLRRWPSFVTGMFARYGCPVELVVITLDRKVAAWAARPIQIGRRTHTLEKLMRPANYEYQSEFARKYFFEGKAEGKAELLLRLLDRKGIAISEHDRQRVLSCTDTAQIESWFDRVLSASTRDEVFES